MRNIVRTIRAAALLLGLIFAIGGLWAMECGETGTAWAALGCVAVMTGIVYGTICLEEAVENER